MRRLRLRIYILILGLCMTPIRAVAFSYEPSVSMHSSQMLSGVSLSHHTSTGYAMRSTSASHMPSMCRANSELTAYGNASGRFSTYVPGVGEDITSSGRPIGNMRRVSENDSSDDPNGDYDVAPVGDVPWAMMMLLVAGYVIRLKLHTKVQKKRARTE